MELQMKLAREGAQQTEMWQRYARAERLLPDNAARLTSDLTLRPRWIADSDQFWYRWKSLAGIEFVLVDPAKGERKPAFDHARLASALSQASGMPCQPHKLPFREIEFSAQGTRLSFDIDAGAAGAAKGRWSCDLRDYSCARLGDKPAPPPGDCVQSPDGRWQAFTRDHNVWIRSVGDGQERALTSDGAAKNDYGAPLLSPLTSAGIEPAPPPAIRWSPDSQRLLFCRVDQRDAPQFHLVQSVNPDGSLRPRLHSYAYPLPGDQTVPLATLFCAHIDGGAAIPVELEPLEVQYHGAPIHADSLWWSHEADTIYFLRQSRGYFQMDLIIIDAATGAARVAITETSATGIDPSIWRGNSSVRVCAGGSRVIWHSPRDGWGHLYLYDADSGELIRPLTSGAFEVSHVKHIDEDAGMVYFTAIGREADRDPYHNYLYRVSLTHEADAELLIPEAADHAVAFSPSGACFIDNASTVDQVPVITLRDADGQQICELERADISALEATGWQAPERFTAKARDGITDLYGVIFRPSHLAEDQQLPVIDYIYGGPQAIQAPAAFADAVRGREAGFWQAQALAELGFAVLMFDGMGMPGRSKAHHDHSYRNLADNGLPDHISAIRQLADEYDYLDISRVGIFGHSAGGYASCQAIFAYPDFFKVAVSSAGNHDHRLDKATWVERYMGLPVAEHYREQANQTLAHQLKGKLLLIHGDMDENVHLASTMVVVDALINANKDFDLLIMPNQAHACTNHAYFVRRRWDYFLRHLLGEEPPSGYQIQ